MSESKLKTAEDVYEDALALSEAERERLKSMLSNAESSGWASPEIEQAWMEEVQQRIKLLGEGKMATLPATDALNRARERLAKLHK